MGLASGGLCETIRTMISLQHCSVEHLAEIFGRCQEEIISEWRVQARKLLRTLRLDHETLTDHLPNLVAEIIRNLALSHSGTLPAELSIDSPPVHGVQRFYDGLCLDEVVAEYGLLRAAFITVAERHGLYVVGEAAHIINHRIDEAVRLAVTAFASEQALTRKEQDDEHLAFIAHDLRTPLNAACLVVEELSVTLDPAARAAAEDIFGILQRNLQRIADLVKKVMDKHADPSPLGSSFHPSLRTFDLWPLVQRLIVDMRPMSAREGITVLNEIPRSLTVCADAGLLSLVFQNLLGNAFKYAPHGQVTVGASSGAEAVTCVVRDNGAGIPPEMLPKVFDKLASDPATEGRGLGLTIVKQIVEAHGGTAHVASTHGEGAEFSFSLPVSPKA
jgi:signal transduction histidine kinase